MARPRQSDAVIMPMSSIPRTTRLRMVVETRDRREKPQCTQSPVPPCPFGSLGAGQPAEFGLSVIFPFIEWRPRAPTGSRVARQPPTTTPRGTYPQQARSRPHSGIHPPGEGQRLRPSYVVHAGGGGRREPARLLTFQRKEKRGRWRGAYFQRVSFYRSRESLGVFRREQKKLRTAGGRS